MKTILKLSISLVPMWFIFLTCKSNHDEWKGSIKNLNGIIKVLNPSNPIYNNILSLDEELTIGESNSPDKPIFAEIRDIGIDNNNRIYVLDPKDVQIQIFDESGKYLNKIGEEGQGPGQFQHPESIYVTQQDELIVNDPAVRKIHYFTLDGSFIRSVSHSNMNMFLSPKVDKDGNIVARYLIPGLEVEMILKIFNSDLSELVTLYKTKILRYPTLNPFSPQIFWAINPKNEIVWGASDRYEFNIIDNLGEPKRIFTREYNPVRIEEEDKSKWIKERFGGLEYVPKGIKLQWDEFHKPFRSLTISDTGYMVIGTFEKAPNGEGYFYDIFDENGRFLSKFNFISTPKIWRKGKIYTIETDEEGLSIIRVYRVKWNIDPRTID